MSRSGWPGSRLSVTFAARATLPGYELRSTMIAVADEIAGAAELVLGKSTGIPAAIVRGVEAAGDGGGSDLVMPRERDLFS